jgi:hypothetical protein
MNQPLNPEENPSSKDQPSILQQADNSAEIIFTVEF